MSAPTRSEIEQRLLDIENKLARQIDANADQIAAAEKQQALFEAMLEAVPVGITVTDENGKIIQGNKELERMVGHPVYHSADAEAYGEWVSFHADGRRVESREYPLARVIREGLDHDELTVHYQRGDGSRFWMRIIGKSVRDENGDLMGAAVACVDVDEEVELKKSQDILIAELNHRVKNAFAVTNAIVGRSLRKGSVDPELRDDIDKRLNAYARAHATLVGADYINAPMHQIASEVLHRIEDSRISLSGDEVALTTRMALPFSMAFYELASNAMKYGSLSSEDGTVDVRWKKERIDGVPSLSMSWIERNGPRAAQPDEEGFGSFVTGRALMAETKGEVRRSYTEKGFEWHFTMPLPGSNKLTELSDIKKVFVVEDEFFVAYEIEDILKELGFEVVGPSLNVEDAQNLAKTAEIDAAFLDVNLGEGKTSEPVAKILRSRDIPFVFITAYTPDQITFRTSDDRVLEKPVTSGKILETLRAVLPDRKSAPS